MSKFVSFEIVYRSGDRFMGNGVIPDFPLQDNEDLFNVEQFIKDDLNQQNDTQDPLDSVWVNTITLINWKTV